MPAQKCANIDDALLAMDINVKKVIVHRGDATGDISHVLAAIANQPALGVIVVDSAKSKINNGHARVANVLVDQFKVPPDRVKFVAVDDKFRKYTKEGSKRTLNNRTFCLYTLTKSTDFVKADLGGIADRPHVFSTMNDVIRGNALERTDSTIARGGTFDRDGNLSAGFQDPMYAIDPICAEFWLHLSMRTGFSFDKPTVVLWGRTSGEQTGIHPEHDYSDKAMAQIIGGLGKKIQVVIAGDFRYESLVNLNDEELKKYWRDKNSQNPLDGVVKGTARIIGKFWDGEGESGLDGSQQKGGAAEIFKKQLEEQYKEDSIGLPPDMSKDDPHVIGKFWENTNFFKNRLNQVRLFYVLEKMIQVHNCRMVHVGMRSGGLDMFGFSGQCIIYLSLKTNDDRMGTVPAVFETAGLASMFQKQELEQLPLKKEIGHYSDQGLKREDLAALVTRIKGVLEVQ